MIYLLLKDNIKVEDVNSVKEKVETRQRSDNNDVDVDKTRCQRSCSLTNHKKKMAYFLATSHERLKPGSPPSMRQSQKNGNVTPQPPAINETVSC